MMVAANERHRYASFVLVAHVAGIPGEVSCVIDFDRRCADEHGTEIHQY
jgi:hypothetical protein